MTKRGVGGGKKKMHAKLRNASIAYYSNRAVVVMTPNIEPRCSVIQLSVSLTSLVMSVIKDLIILA